MSNKLEEAKPAMDEPAWVCTFTTPGIKWLNKIRHRLSEDSEHIRFSFGDKGDAFHVWERKNNSRDWKYVTSMNTDTEAIVTETSGNVSEVILDLYSLTDFLKSNLLTLNPMKMSVYDGEEEPTVKLEFTLPPPLVSEVFVLD